MSEIKNIEIERATRYAELRKQLDTPKNHALLEHLNAIAALDDNRGMWRRMPLCLELPTLQPPMEKPASFTLSEGEGAVFDAKCCVNAVLTHLIVSDETSRHFDMVDMKIGKDSTLLTAESVPLEFFSVDHNKKSLAKVSEIRSFTCSPDQFIRLFVRRRLDGYGDKTFNGLLWIEVAR